MTETALRLPNVSSPLLRAHALAVGESFTGAGYEAFFPGRGHAPDNLVVWFPEHRILFGGCLIKAKEARDLGFIADADLGEWPGAVTRVQKRYPAAQVVVPGHGEPTDGAALEHTLELIGLTPAKR